MPNPPPAGGLSYLTTDKISALYKLLKKPPEDPKKIPTFIRLKSFVQVLSNTYFSPLLYTSIPGGLNNAMSFINQDKGSVDNFISTYNKPGPNNITSSDTDPCHYTTNVYSFFWSFYNIRGLFHMSNDPGLNEANNMLMSMFHGGQYGFVVTPAELAVCPQFQR